MVELEELFEHVLAESDLHRLSRKLAFRLGKSMTSVQQQVADRAIACWNSPACVRVMNAYEKIGQVCDAINILHRNALSNIILFVGDV